MQNSFNVKLIDDYADFLKLSLDYNLKISEILQIDINRCGVYLPNNEIKESFRVRLKGKILDDYETWLAVPVRNKIDTNYYIKNGEIYFKDKIIGKAGKLNLDTCDTSYQRGPHLLNLNSRSRSGCGGCKACIHNYHDIYDKTVIKDNKSLETEDDIRNYFLNLNVDIKELVQIAVVTGLFRNEEHVVSHMKLIHKVAQSFGFNGQLMYFGCQVNSDEALRELASLGNFYLIYAIDNFTKRNEILNTFKSKITIDDAMDTLSRAKKLGIKTNISYICGIDSLDSMENGFKKIKLSITNFPIINVYQMQTHLQKQLLNPEAEDLEYYLKARRVIEKIFKDTSLRPRRWENYRPLWYKYFDNEELPDNSYGQLERNDK